MAKLLNVTSEPYKVDDYVVEPSGFIAKARDQWRIHKNPPGVPMGTPRKVDHWVETNLPDQVSGVYYIVDHDVYKKLRSKRSDVLH